MPYEIPGLIVSFNQHYLLVYGPDAEALGVPILGSPVFLRPGYRLWEAPEYLLPHSVIDDIGQVFEPPEAYTWLEAQGDLYPRADVLGYRVDGAPRDVVVKALDLADMAVFAAARPDAGPFLRLALAVEACPVPDAYALAPAEPPVALLGRALPSYRLAPGVLPLSAAEGGGGPKSGAVGAAILNQLLVSRRRDWWLTYDELDDMTGGL